MILTDRPHSPYHLREEGLWHSLLFHSLSAVFQTCQEFGPISSLGADSESVVTFIWPLLLLLLLLILAVGKGDSVIWFYSTVFSRNFFLSHLNSFWPEIYVKSHRKPGWGASNRRWYTLWCCSWHLRLILLQFSKCMLLNQKTLILWVPHLLRIKDCVSHDHT